MSKKHSKNLQKVQDMLDGKGTGKIQSGYIPENIHANRKIGERWIDSEGDEWEQKDGYRSKISTLGTIASTPPILFNLSNCNFNVFNFFKSPPFFTSEIAAMTFFLIF